MRMLMVKALSEDGLFFPPLENLLKEIKECMIKVRIKCLKFVPRFQNKVSHNLAGYVEGTSTWEDEPHEL